MEAILGIIVVLLRRNNTITIPIYLWLNNAWVEVQTLTALQLAAFVTARLAMTEPAEGFHSLAVPSQVPIKVDGLTISPVQF